MFLFNKNMKIQKLDNTTFGYNKKLNRQLIKKLDAENESQKFVTQTIRDLNTFCNNTEDILSIYTGNKDSKSGIIEGVFIPSKLALAAIIEEKYPELNFAELEAKTYEKEGEKITSRTGEKYPWQFTIANELSYDANHDDAEDLTPEQEKKLKEAEEKSTTRQIKHKNDILPRDIDNDLLERYTPNEFSPKGFDDLGGLKDLKEKLFDKIIYPANHPEEAALDLAEYGKRQPRGIMLYGPPGCGKTSITEALSQEAGLPLFKLKISKAGSPYINQTSSNYQKAFDYVAECSQMINTPCFMFIDEIDGMTKGRDKDSSGEDLKQMGTLLNLIENARSRNIIVIGATNKYDIIDDAIKRRFDEQIYIGMPDTDTRKQILYKTLTQWLKGIPLAEEENDLKEIAERTSGFPSSALVILCDKASDIARKDGRRLIKKEDFFSEIEKNQNLKIKENDYKSISVSRKIGYRQD